MAADYEFPSSLANLMNNYYSLCISFMQAFHLYPDELRSISCNQLFGRENSWKKVGRCRVVAFDQKCGYGKFMFGYP